MLVCELELPVLLLYFVEQPHVLDCDYRLIGEGLEQSNLSLREGLRLVAAECDRANRNAFSHQRDAKERAEAPASCVFAALGKFGIFALQVSNMNGPAIENRSARNCPADKGEGLRRGSDRDGRRGEAGRRPGAKW